MVTVPHIDIIGDERIHTLLEYPSTYVWRAIDCEMLDGWDHDLGTTDYRYPSIYRPPSIANAGIPSFLQHRFWDTVFGQRDHRGTRYLGVLLYDVAGEECPMEFQIADVPIGRVEPTRHDNRRHLIVVDRQIPFAGGMEVFQMTAPATGTCRIEAFVLLAERPEPSSFAPRIKNLSARIVSRTGDYVTAEVHFITTEPATCLVEAVPESGSDATGRVSLQTERHTVLHVVEVPELLEDTRYSIRLTATEKAGESANETIHVDTREQEQPRGTPTTAAVEICNLDAAISQGMPLTFGVPLPQGALLSPTGCQIQSGSQRYSAQARVHARWPDGTAQWALVDAPCPADLAPMERMPAEVIFAPGASPQQQGLTWEQRDDVIMVTAENLRVTVDVHERWFPACIERRDTNGRWTPQYAENGELAIVLGNGLALQAGGINELTLEEAGIERVVIRYRVLHEDKSGLAHLRSTIRLHIYAHHPMVKVVHRLEVVSPALRGPTGGNLTELGPEFAEVRSAIAGSDGEQTSLLTVQSCVLRLPRPGTTRVTLNGRTTPVPEGGAWRLVHEHDLEHRIELNGEVEKAPGRTRGHLLVEGTTPALAISVRNFWETYPKGVHVTQEMLGVELLPPLSGEPLPGDEDAWHRLYFWYQDGLYKLKAGVALTSEVLLTFTEDAKVVEAICAWFEQPPVVRPKLEQLKTNGTFGNLTSKIDSPLSRYEALVEKACDAWLADREHSRAYGFLNFGDWYGESGWSWGNNEYDPPFCHYIEFLRGGDTRWARYAAQSVRHLTDVDTTNSSVHASQVGGQYAHMPGHAGGYLPPFFRSKMGGSTSIPSHSWVEGPVLHYLLTGDEAVRETLNLIGRWLLVNARIDSGLEHYDFINARESGWHIIHLCALARTTDDSRYLNAAQIMVDKVLEKQGPDGGWVRMLREGHCGCGYPRCRGEASFMVGILLSALRRFHEVTGDERVAEAIVAGARWLMAHNFDHERGHFRNATCPNRDIDSSGPQHDRTVLEGLAYAYQISQDSDIGGMVAHCMNVMNQPPELKEDMALGKAMFAQMRCLPFILHAAKAAPNDVAQDD